MVLQKECDYGTRKWLLSCAHIKKSLLARIFIPLLLYIAIILADNNKGKRRKRDQVR